ncbi:MULTISPECIES: YecA family protein [unclassified Oleiphilus]|jgi:uncharacterized protein|uniref:YecA/YgfB family protein n=6 Tax=Oleiphilus TaxID=141450 RepID=UPI0007C3FA84|nr:MULTISPECIES: YecA family protein [unclassified Oleiphilus]KZY47945.1 hypothetical protein A3732_24710 [Oleiphilus sp. HI0050]KZY75313.1 hypothetical protein A3740_15480 [Oleiphilus sp. HI0068]KZY77292.1 hypothetical protein A3741_22565 [Oleiphilus sp. HI0069]KZY92767.1 hypothetical protein A3743_06410 [Oleiphilus sp. HI0072]KZZ06939.1 hypothetical protein A3749_16230 [Oleiphilus sp. HI0078]KZZ28772.1 hypothetical protein A3752_03570 [Oleiphilus sp. HI0081]KZZ34101.1 hypothetical protein 
MSLSEQQIEQLEDILFAEHLNEEALDYFGFHGLVCASVIGPVDFDTNTLISVLFGNDDIELSESEIATIESCIEEIKSTLLEEINEDRDILLPYSDETDDDSETHYDACLESWCTGFMEGFFYKEKAWFCKGEDVTAELLLPIMALSGLFDSDEFQEIRRNEKLLSQFEEIMPEQLVDIFLFYHSD